MPWRAWGGSERAAGARRLLHELNERLKADAADREAASKAEVVITDAGVPPTMRVVPPAAAADMEGAAPAA